MQTKPANWDALFNAPHKTEYKFVINGVDYTGGNINGTPTIIKPLLDKPALGRICTGSLSLTVLAEGLTTIPKAAQVDAYCRLRAAFGDTVSGWLQQGRYYITSRSGGSTLKLTCLDGMIKAGTTYRDKTTFTEWPQTMIAVVTEIASIMGVSVDSRTVLNNSPDYVVDYPNDDTLISEILSMIASAHGGSWIMTESGKLRLVVFASPQTTSQQLLGKTHTGYRPCGKSCTVSRVILTDNADNDFTAGDDTGITLAVRCDYATQQIASALCDGSESVLYGVSYTPHVIEGAYLNPCLELGDTLSVTDRYGNDYRIVLQTIKINCTIAYTCAVSAYVDEETEDEYPFIAASELAVSRSIRTNQTYFGNRLTRSEGFISELLVNSEVKARMTANASVFAMQTQEDGAWVDRIYFDTQTGKYVITADVTVNGAVTFNDLSTSGSTIINGDNIQTGTIAAARVNLSSYSTTAQINALIDGLEIHVSSAEGDISVLEQTTSSLSSSISTANGNISTLQQTVSTLSSKIQTAEGDISVLEQTTSSLSSSISTANGNISTLQQTSTSLTIRMGTAENNIANVSFTADKVYWLISSGTSSSNFQMTSRAINLVAANINLSGYVTFSALSNSGYSTINGDNITTGTLRASLIAANNGVYIEFAHPIMTTSIGGLSSIYFGEYAYITKSNSNYNTPLVIYGYQPCRFYPNHPVVRINNIDYTLISEYNIANYIPSTTAVFG